MTELDLMAVSHHTVGCLLYVSLPQRRILLQHIIFLFPSLGGAFLSFRVFFFILFYQYILLKSVSKLKWNVYLALLC